MMLKVLIAAKHIPDGAMVSKRTGEKAYILKRKIIIYFPNTENEKQLITAGPGAVMLIPWISGDSGNINAIPESTELLWHVESDELIACLDEECPDQEEKPRSTKRKGSHPKLDEECQEERKKPLHPGEQIVASAIRWLANFAILDLKMEDEDELINGLDNYLDTGQEIYLTLKSPIPANKISKMWKYYQIVTGRNDAPRNVDDNYPFRRYC